MFHALSCPPGETGKRAAGTVKIGVSSENNIMTFMVEKSIYAICRNFFVKMT